MWVTVILILLHILYFCFVCLLCFMWTPKADSFQKCGLGNNVCIAQTFTYIVQHLGGKLDGLVTQSVEGEQFWISISFLEFPELGAPNLDPFISPRPFKLQTLQFTSLFTANSVWSDITVRGIDTGTTVQEIRYIQFIKYTNVCVCVFKLVCDNFDNFRSVVFNQINPFRMLN